MKFNSMKFIPTPLPGAFIIEIEPLADERGFFARTVCQNEFSKHGLEGGFVQQHLMTATKHSGEVLAWPVCIVVRIENDRIVRLDEYIDRAGIFTPGPGAVATPGF